MSRQTAYTQRQQARQECHRCRLPKVGKDLAHWNCFACRLIIAAQQSVRYHGRFRMNRRKVAA